MPPTELDGGFGRVAVGLGGPQGGGAGRLWGIVHVVRGRDGGVTGGRRDVPQVRDHVDAGVGHRLEGAGGVFGLLPVLGVGDAGVQAPADAARGFRGVREQQFLLGPGQGRGRAPR